MELSYKNIDEYIELQPEHIRPILVRLHKKLKETLPEAEERISWRMPTYWKKQNIIHFAAFKNHIGVYPGEKAVEFFSERLAKYKTSKGTIQFPIKEELPLDLIAEIAIWNFNFSQKL